jgi:hypothetical protein
MLALLEFLYPMPDEAHDAAAISADNLLPDKGPEPSAAPIPPASQL